MIRWNHYYLVLSLMSIMLLGGVWFKVDPLALLSSLMATMIIVTVYSLLAILQYLSYHRHTVPATPPELRRIEGQ
jgi:membrane protein YdbS with pleckstrin-like domain